MAACDMCGSGTAFPWVLLNLRPTEEAQCRISYCESCYVGGMALEVCFFRSHSRFGRTGCTHPVHVVQGILES